MLGSRNEAADRGGAVELAAARLPLRRRTCRACHLPRVFPRGLGALDNLDEATLGTRPSLAHVTARDEVMSLIATLKLPLDARGQRRAAARAAWFAALQTRSSPRLIGE